jgi:hypothetical protein
MELVTKVNRHTHIERWIKLWNGGLNLTDKEQLFFGELLYRAMELHEKNITEPYLGQLVFGSNVMAEIQEKLSLSKQGLNNYKMSLKDKGVIFKGEDGFYHIEPKLMPQTQVTFKFQYSE